MPIPGQKLMQKPNWICGAGYMVADGMYIEFCIPLYTIDGDVVNILTIRHAAQDSLKITDI